MSARARGFTLLELMVASSLSLIVLAAALWSAAELQRRGTFEESLMEAQNTLRAVRELLVLETQRAGMGLGSARMIYNGDAAGRYALIVSPQDPFDGTGWFPRQAGDTFVATSPNAAYANRKSDAFQVWSWDSGAQDEYEDLLGMVSLTACSGGTRYRSGNELCAINAPRGLKGRRIMVVRPNLPIACVMRVTKVVEPPSGSTTGEWRIVVDPGFSDTDSDPPTDPCGPLDAGVTPQDGQYSFWVDNSTGGYVLPMRGATFRVNWASGGPVLERQDISSDVSPTAPVPRWMTLTRDVEMIRFSQGLVEELGKPGAKPLWFPDEAVSPRRPALTRAAVATGNLDSLFKDAVASGRTPGLDNLMSRLRMLQVTIVTRTARLDSSLIRKDGGGNFIPDAEGHPQDGYKRRSSTLEIMPRNFAFAGVAETQP